MSMLRLYASLYIYMHIRMHAQEWGRYLQAWFWFAQPQAPGAICRWTTNPLSCMKPSAFKCNHATLAKYRPSCLHCPGCRSPPSRVRNTHKLSGSTPSETASLEQRLRCLPNDSDAHRVEDIIHVHENKKIVG